MEGGVASASALLLLLLFVAAVHAQDPNQLVPAIITFGDSSVDVGNNNYIATVFRADYPPYGRDFTNHEATGRFCNGKLATDLTADTLGFSKYPLPYLSPEASGKNLLIGANFASAGSGFDDQTALLTNVIPLSQQMANYREYKSKLAEVAGPAKAANITGDALYVVSTGSTDYVQNYYINPLINKVYSPQQYGDYLISIYTSFIKDLYGEGARRIGVTSLPPLGCVPATITLFGMGSNECVDRINQDALYFNKKLNSATDSLKKQLPNLKIAVFDAYQPVLDLVKNPSKSGFAEARKGCCGTGIVETTTLLCNPKSPGTCANATQYVFWDAVHPSQAANQVLADSLLLEGIALIG